MISNFPGCSPNDSSEEGRLYISKTIGNESHQKEKAHQVRPLVLLACILLLVGNKCGGVELFEFSSVKIWKHSTHATQTGDVSFSANRNTPAAENNTEYPSQFVVDPSRNIWASKLITISTHIFYGVESPRDGSRRTSASSTNERNNASPSSQNGGHSAAGTLRLVSSPSTSQTPTRTATISTTTSCTTIGSSTSTGLSSSSNPSTSSGSSDRTIIQGSSTVSHTATATPLGRPSSSIHDADEEGRGSTSESNENVSVPNDEEADYMQEDWNSDAERFVPLGNLVEGDFFVIDSSTRSQRNNLTSTLENLGGLANGLSTINPEHSLPIANGISPFPVNAVGPNVGVEDVPEGNGLIDDQNQINHHVHSHHSNVLSFATTPSPEVGRLFGSEYYNPIMVAAIDHVQKLRDIEALCASIDTILADNEEC